MHKHNFFYFLSYWLTFIVCFSSQAGDENSKWHYPTNKKTIYLFAPGIWASESQASFYCKTMHASTGEEIINHNNFEAMEGNKVIACNFSEVKRKLLSNNKGIKLRPWALATALVNFFAPYFIKRSYNNRKITINPCSQQTHTINPFLIKLKNINVGQEKDIKILSDQYDTIVKKSSESDIVLYGFSRGAAAAFNFVATQYSAKNIRNIKAIVLEGCFDSVANLRFGLFSKLLSYLFPYYKHRGTEPIKPEILQNFVTICNEYKIPILFVTSKSDRVVPHKNVVRLYEALQKEGLQNCQLVELQKAKHSNYVNNEEEKHVYERAVHHFYEQHNLPYIPY